MTPDDMDTNAVAPNDQELIRRRQKSRALVVALLLGAFVVLIFFITIAKINQGMAH